MSKSSWPDPMRIMIKRLGRRKSAFMRKSTYTITGTKECLAKRVFAFFLLFSKDVSAYPVAISLSSGFIPPTHTDRVSESKF